MQELRIVDFVFYEITFVLAYLWDKQINQTKLEKMCLPYSFSQAALGRVKSKLYEELV